MKQLTKEQQKSLVEIVMEESGTDLDALDFAERVHLLLEDVPGFEVMQSKDSVRILNQLWRLYNAECKRNRAY